jgi:hypothetical protein
MPPYGLGSLHLSLIGIAFVSGGAVNSARNYLPILLLAMALGVQAQRTTVPNGLFRKPKDPTLELLSLYRVTAMNRDSAYAALSDGSVLYLSFRNKRVWEVRRTDRQGVNIDIGDLAAGTGQVTLEVGSMRYFVDLVDGVLQGSAGRWRRHLGEWYPDVTYTFDKGLLHGEMHNYSSYRPGRVSVTSTYAKGLLQQVDRFGRKRFGYGFLYFFPSWMVDHDFLCSRSMYTDGKLVSNECYVKKCRRCALY